MIKRIAVVMALSLMAMLGSAVVAGPARADDARVYQDGDCDYNAHNFGSAGYSVNGYPVWITPNWQYVGDWTSFCRDINFLPSSGYYWTHGIVKVRTYMCNSSGSCWYNAWRNCQGGCQAATNMVDGTQYQVHIYSPQNLGPGWQIYD